MIFEIINKGKGIITELTPSNLLLLGGSSVSDITKTSQLINDGDNGTTQFVSQSTVNELILIAVQNELNNLPSSVSQTINSGVIAKSPSENAVFNALSFKIDANDQIVSGTKTKITFDEKGLVVGGSDATTVDIQDTVDKRYVTDNHLNSLNNLSVVAITNNYDDLTNLPVTSYIYNQTTPTNVWLINHPMNKKPSVTVINTLGLTVEGQVFYDSINTIRISFASAFAGMALLN